IKEIQHTKVTSLWNGPHLADDFWKQKNDVKNRKGGWTWRNQGREVIPFHIGTAHSNEQNLKISTILIGWTVRTYPELASVDFCWSPAGAESGLRTCAR